MNANGNSRTVHTNPQFINPGSFEKARARSSRRTLEEWLFIVFVILLLCGILFVICGLLFFRAKEVRVEGGSYYPAVDILNACGISENDNLFFIEEEALEQSLTLRFPYLSGITLVRQLPTTLIIRVEEDHPAYVTRIGEDYFLLSESLRVLKRGDSEEEVRGDIPMLRSITLPTVTYALVGRALGFERDSTHGYLLDFLSVLNTSEYRERVTRVDAKSKFRISVYLDNGKYKVVFGSAENAAEKLTFFTNIKNRKLNPDDCAIVDVSDVERAFVSIRDQLIED